MTIKAGEPWGSVGPPPDDLVLVHSDGELSELITRRRSAGEHLPAVGLVAGDLCRAVGGTGNLERLRGEEVAILPVDLLRVEVVVAGERRTWWAASHVLVRRSWWRGPITAVMNSQFRGQWDVAPRGHPNDGRADVVEVDAGMAPSERWKAWRRLPGGLHVPHPMIRVRRVREVEVELTPRSRVEVDGRRLDLGSGLPGGSLTVAVEPDALCVCV